MPLLPRASKLGALARAVNSATAQSVAPVVSDIYGPTGAKLAEGTFGTLEEYLENHIEFLVKLLALTPRPTATLLKEAITMALPDVTPGVVSCYACLAPAIINKGRRTKRNTTTGERLDTAMTRQVIMMMTAIKIMIQIMSMLTIVVMMTITHHHHHHRRHRLHHHHHRRRHHHPRHRRQHHVIIVLDVYVFSKRWALTKQDVYSGRCLAGDTCRTEDTAIDGWEMPQQSPHTSTARSANSSASTPTEAGPTQR